MIINFLMLVVQLLAPHWRTASVVALFRSAALPFQYCNTILDTQRKKNDYEFKHTSQQCYVRGALNDAIDAYSRGIVVEDVESLDFFYLYANDEPVDSMLDEDTLIYSGTICGVNGVSFQVKIPESLFTENIINQAKSIVIHYKTIGKSFTVIKK